MKLINTTSLKIIDCSSGHFRTGVSLVTLHRIHFSHEPYHARSPARRPVIGIQPLVCLPQTRNRPSATAHPGLTKKRLGLNPANALTSIKLGPAIKVGCQSWLMSWKSSVSTGGCLGKSLTIENPKDSISRPDLNRLNLSQHTCENESKSPELASLEFCI